MKGRTMKKRMTTVVWKGLNAPKDQVGGERIRLRVESRTLEVER